MPHPIVSMATKWFRKGGLAALLAAACAPAVTGAGGKSSPDADSTAAFYADERNVLGLLAATDPRIARRTGIEPSADQSGKAVLGAILAEDPNAALEANRTDLFSFDVRARALAEARKSLAKYTSPVADPHPNDGRRPDLELVLLRRLLDEEDARLTEERHLPQSGAILVRAAAATWSPPRTAADLEQRDAWFATRIESLRTSLAPKSLRAADIADLEDALDPLERVAFGDGTPYAKSHAAFTDLRIALGSLAAGPGPDPQAARTALVGGLKAHLGVTLSPETLARIFETAAASLERSIADLVGAKLTDARFETEARSLLDPAPCTFRAPTILRKATPPPERALACILPARAEKAKTSDELVGVLAQAHTALVVGSWALWNVAGADAVKPAADHAKTLRPLPQDLVARLERRALTMPVAAVGNALVAEWLYRDGMTASTSRGLAWMVFGDAPFDLLERELHPHAIVPQKPPVVTVTDGPAPSGSYTSIPVTPIK